MIKDILLLGTISFDISLIVLEKGVVRDVVRVLNKDTTIPTKSCLDLYLENHQNVEVEIDNVRMTSDISRYFQEIHVVICDANQGILIIGKKDKKEVRVQLSTLMKNCPRKIGG